MKVTLMTAKELAREEDMPIGEHKLRSLSNKYEDFPVIRNGNRKYFIKEEVLAWFKKYSTYGIRI